MLMHKASTPPVGFAQPALSHLPSLDGLRGLAVLLVVPHNLRLLTDPTDWGTRLLTMVLDRGWIGVQLFFVLSGFLITRILMQTSAASNYYSGFYARRGLRIWPLYYSALLILLMVLPAIGWLPRHDASKDIYFWLFLSNFVQPFPHGGPDLPHFWSLAIEEQFYLLWPLLIRHATPQRVIQLCMGVALASGGIRLAMLLHGVSADIVYIRTPCRIDALALGAAAAALLAMPRTSTWLTQRRHLLWVMPVLCLLAGAAVSGGYRQYGLMSQTLGYSLLALGCAALILGVTAADQGWAPPGLTTLRSPWMRRVGRYSFGMYVIHVPLGTLVMAPLAKHMGWQTHPSAVLQCAYVGAGVLLTYGLAALIYHGFERRFLQLKDRFAPQYPRVAANATVI